MFVDQKIPDWFKIPPLGEAEIAVRLSIKSWLAGMGFSTSDCIWGLLFLFKHFLHSSYS